MVRLYEEFVFEDVKLEVSKDVFTVKLMTEIKNLLEEDEAKNTENTGKKKRDVENVGKEKPKVMLIAKYLKPIVTYITKHNPVKYILLFSSKGINGLASLLPEDSKIREILVKVYNKLESTMKSLFELPHEPGEKSIDIGGYKVDRSKIIGFVIAAFSYCVILGAIMRKIDEIRSKNTTATESVISIKEYMLMEQEIGAPKSPVGLVSTMIKKYGETTSLADRIVDETKKTFIKIIATIIAAAISLVIFYLMNCTFFKLFIRIDAMIKRTSYDEYKEIVKTFLSDRETKREGGMRGIGVFTNMYITLCNIFGETLKINMFRKEDLNNTLLKCLKGDSE